MAGWTGAQPRQAGGKFGSAGRRLPATGQPSPQAISGITITPEMYRQALKQAAAIIRAQNAQRAALSKMSPGQRQLYGQTQSVLRSNAAKLAGEKRKKAAAARKAVAASSAARARLPGARAAGAAMARRSPSSAPARVPASGSFRPPASASAVQARLASYVRRP